MSDVLGGAQMKPNCRFCGTQQTNPCRGICDALECPVPSSMPVTFPNVTYRKVILSDGEGTINVKSSR